MQAVILNGTLSLHDVPIPTPPPGEALIRVTRAGICNTDIELARGYMAFQGIPGHEFVGVVEQSPDPAWVGRRVVGEINANCGTCETCRAGRPTHCPHRTTLGIVHRNGVFAEYVSLPVHLLHTVPDGVSDDEAVFTEPLAAALEVLQQVQVRPTDRVVVLGDGKLGLLIAQVMGMTGAAVTAIGRHPEKLAILERRGIRTSVSGAGVAPGADIVVEATGSLAGFQQGRALVRPRGTLVLKSTFAGDLAPLLAGDGGLNFLSAVIVDEITLVGSRCGPFAPALRLLAEGRIDVQSLIHARYPLAEAVAAFDHAQRPGVLKVLLDL